MADYEDYTNLCRRAVNDTATFKLFRGAASCMRMVETVSCELGHQLYILLTDEMKALLPRFATSEKCGYPGKIVHYNGLRLSPTTLRYVKILQDLKKLFGTLDGLHIVEVGGGYGGQCKIIYDLFKPASYTIVDLPEVGALQKKFLERFNITADIVAEAPMGSFDLFISNFAYAEFEPKVRRLYQPLIKRCSQGFIICNFLSVAEAKREIGHNGFILPEQPLSYKDNFIYAWK